ncbi:VWA domain-containing protein, partial [Vibrio makurazakiensis]|uniref:vWA domain-containing protein n=1 Tax=Vibrio makurazakiensis TaxID=2910250 RepID=UPI003D1463D5
YDISITTMHEAWFPGSENFIGLDEKYSVSHAGTARKYQGDSIDIAFVTDFSGSMDYWWGTKKKYQEVQDIISNVLVELEKFNQENASPDELNKVALIPFAEYSVDAVGDNCKGSRSKRKIYYSDQIVYGGNKKQRAKNTVADLWQVKGSDERCDKASKYDYYTTPLTSDLASVERDINSFSPYGGTASYQGIIRAAQVLKATNDPNPRRLIVILSDGDDNDSDMTSALVEKGMCTEIIDGLSADRTVSGRPVTAQLALIGFTYDVSDNKALAQCVGESNVYDASNPDELLEIILNLISEEIGHIK